MTAKELDQHILTLISHGALAPLSHPFNTLALQIFAHQFELIPFYQKFCRRHGVTPSSVRNWKEIPPLPTLAFKQERIASFPATATVATFQTSGTTEEKRGTHEMDTLALYDEASLISYRDFAGVTPEVVLSLAPSRFEAPRSSLAHMVDTIAQHFCHGRVVHAFHDDALDPILLAETIDEHVSDGRPLLIASTTVALADWLEHLRDTRAKFVLPKGSHLFETGGRKGRKHLLSTSELALLAQELLGIPPEHYMGEYGMTELSSPSWGHLQNGRMIYRSPSWCPVRIVHPETKNEVEVGEEGMVSVFDLANRGSVAALLTGDWGVRCENGFEVSGRIAESEMRGCSLMVPASSRSSFHTSIPHQSFHEVKTSLQNAPPAPLEQTIRSLDQLTKRWLSSGSGERKAFEADLERVGFFSPGSVTAGLNRTFEAVTEPELQAVAAQAWPKGRPEQREELAVYIPAGNLPVTGVFDFYGALLSGVLSIHRPSSRGGNLLRLLKKTLNEIDPQLSQRTAIVETDSSNDETTRALLVDAAYVTAQGDAVTLEHLFTLTPASARFRPYRSGLSVAVIPKLENVADSDWEGLAQDIFIWEQQGCLSPQILFVRATDVTEIKTIAKKLTEISHERGREWKRVPAERDHARIEWWTSLEPSVVVSHQLTVPITTTIRPEWFGTPGLIQIIPVESAEQIQVLLNDYRSSLSSVAIPKITNQNFLLDRFPHIRIVRWGELQSPRFDWMQDGKLRLLA